MLTSHYAEFPPVSAETVTFHQQTAVPGPIPALLALPGRKPLSPKENPPLLSQSVPEPPALLKTSIPGNCRPTPPCSPASFYPKVPARQSRIPLPPLRPAFSPHTPDLPVPAFPNASDTSGMPLCRRSPRPAYAASSNTSVSSPTPSFPRSVRSTGDRVRSASTPISSSAARKTSVPSSLLGSFPGITTRSAPHIPPYASPPFRGPVPPLLSSVPATC